MAKTILQEGDIVLVQYTAAEHANLDGPNRLARLVRDARKIVTDAFPGGAPIDPVATVKNVALFALEAPQANALRAIAALPAELDRAAERLDPTPTP